ncbi:hypothetical protein [Methanoregula sp.]|uniref:hypothetical protein n=1 Tax=Methanoregula sp. TaxID=2052170 RepID=UPI0026335A33|nr:hypothetical protein [Methanoregula sp.]MDD5142831.1 hypothetical protein [Methanoregula sp.]
MDIRAGIIAREGIDTHNSLWNFSLYKICPWVPEVIRISLHHARGWKDPIRPKPDLVQRLFK